MTKTNENQDLDLKITKIDRRNSGGGSWVIGTIDGKYKFNALVFPEHAESEDYELSKSRISKLWIQDIAKNATVYNFDRGLDIAATNVTVATIVGFLCEGLADLIYA
jgi:hypothetical protein